ncbi:hypothetical protein VTL71DRAFT_14873 [Oculimacula yallundae]|uniref:Uncharacterized protein n=1 Tax=Oculimacula yallundae TaxID=86028 RepID=A0ABR4CH18_9HELO
MSFAVDALQKAASAPSNESVNQSSSHNNSFNNPSSEQSNIPSNLNLTQGISATATLEVTGDVQDGTGDEDETRGKDVPSEKVLHECETVPEVLEALVDGVLKHLENLKLFTFEPQIDFEAEEIFTADDLIRMVAQNAFNAGIKWRAERSVDMEIKKNLAARTTQRHRERSEKRAVRKQRRLQKQNRIEGDEVEESEDSGSYHDTGDSDTSEDEDEVAQFAAVGSVDWYTQQDGLEAEQEEYDPQEEEDVQTSKKRKLAVPRDTVAASKYHSLAAMEQAKYTYTHQFGAVEGLYHTAGPSIESVLPLVDNDSCNDEADDDSNGRGSFISKPTKTLAKKPRRKPYTKKKTTTGPKRGAGRTHDQKVRPDWGIPRPYISKTQFFALRRHAKLTTTAFNTRGPNDINNVKLTHREAIRYSNISATFTYVKELGDIPSEDATIDANLVRWEKWIRKKIRNGLAARVERQAKGDFHDSDSSISDDEGQYDKDVNAEDVLDDSELIVDGEDEEVRQGAVRRKTKGKGRATKQTIEDDEDEDSQDDEGNESEDHQKGGYASVKWDLPADFKLSEKRENPAVKEDSESEEE